MPAPLEYARPTTFPKTLALPSMTGGLIGGPLGPALAMVCDLHFAPYRKMLVLLAMWGPIAVAFVFSLVVMFTLPKASRPRDRTFAKTGVGGSVVWALIFAAFAVAVTV